MRKAGNGSLFFVIFISSIFDKKLSLLMDPSIRQVDLLDADGGTLELRSSGNMIRRGSDSTMEASFALASFPLSIRVRADKQALLETSLKRIRTFMPLALGCAAAALALFGYGLVFSRHAMRADILDSELAAKELLFHEVNHRVKNNLAVAGSIIGLGEGMVLDAPDDKKTQTSIEVFRDTRNRLVSMSMLHEQLYKHASLAVVDLGAYLGELSELLATSYALSGIRIHADVTTGLRLNLSNAVPVALIVNELVTNAIKHAFPGGGGEIRIHARATATGGIEVEVSDDGIGSGENGQNGFGSSLMEGLASQIDAELRQLKKEQGGTAWLVSIPSAATEASAMAGPTKYTRRGDRDRRNRRS
jgi:two-component sensor histidine kinase